MDRRAGYFEEGTNKTYPKTAKAIDVLRAAMNEELPTLRNRVKPKHSQQPPAKKRRTGSVSRKHYQHSVRLTAKVKGLEAKLAHHTTARAYGKCISPEWLVKIFLTSPGRSSRGLTQAFRDVIGMDQNSVSRPSIDKVRGAWVEHYKKMVMQLAADQVASTLCRATYRQQLPILIFLRWIHDEADIRLRSGATATGQDSDAAACQQRSRCSKVQQQVATLFTSDGELDISTELAALGNKSAATLTTNLEQGLRSIATAVLPATGDVAQPPASARATPHASVPAKPEPDIWFVHVLVGDGIATNDAAAKQLWACLQQK